MALTSMTCIDSLSFKFSLHHLEDAYSVAKPSFCFSWPEPFALDFAGRARETNPKRSRSQPTALLGSTKTSINSGKKENRRVRSVDFFRASTSDYNRRTEVFDNTYPCDIQSNNSTSARNLPLAGSTYVNKKAASCDCEDDFTSDEELAELCGAYEEKKKAPTNEKLFSVKKEKIYKEDTDEKAKTRKRTLDNSHNSTDRNATKRPRPRLDFEKMRLSRSETLKQNCSTKILFDETFFKPILPTDNFQ